MKKIIVVCLIAMLFVGISCVCAGGGGEIDPDKIEFAFPFTEEPMGNGEVFYPSDIIGRVQITNYFQIPEITEIIENGVYATIVLTDPIAGNLSYNSMVPAKVFNTEGNFVFYYKDKDFTQEQRDVLQDYVNRAGKTFQYYVHISYKQNNEWKSRVSDRYEDYPIKEERLLTPEVTLKTSPNVEILRYGLQGSINDHNSLFAWIDVLSFPGRVEYFEVELRAYSQRHGYKDFYMTRVLNTGRQTIWFKDFLYGMAKWEDFLYHTKGEPISVRIIVYRSDGVEIASTIYKQIN